MQDVPAALVRRGLAIEGYFDPSRPAVLDAEHAVRVNYETYLFADLAARDAFRRDIVRFCGLVTDPVTKRRFRPKVTSPRSVDDQTGVAYLFESEGARDMFTQRPEAFRLPGYRMGSAPAAASEE